MELSSLYHVVAATAAAPPTAPLYHTPPLPRKANPFRPTGRLAQDRHGAKIRATGSVKPYDGATRRSGRGGLRPMRTSEEKGHNDFEHPRDRRIDQPIQGASLEV